MFSLRCFTVMFLIIGLVVTVFYVQEAKADECDDALSECYRAALDEFVICAYYGSNSTQCIQAKGRAISKCLQAVIICEN